MSAVIALLLGALLAYFVTAPIRVDGYRWRVVQALRGGDWHSMNDISEHSHLSPGTVQFTLADLEKDGAMESRWNEGASPRVGLYRLKLRRDHEPD